MKHIILIITILSFFSCSIDLNNELDIYTGSTIDESLHLIHELIEYKSEGKNHDEWQTWRTTAALQTGDCEDFSILLIEVMIQKFGVFPNLIIIEIEKEKGVVVERNGDYYWEMTTETSAHALVEHNGTYYDPTWNEISKSIDYKIKNKLDYLKTLEQIDLKNKIAK